jgi:hypothetical protein
VLVTTDAKKKVREHRGLVAWFFYILFFPFIFIWRVLFGRKQKYEKKQHWHCNYCGKDFKQEF